MFRIAFLRLVAFFDHRTLRVYAEPGIRFRLCNFIKKDLSFDRDPGSDKESRGRVYESAGDQSEMVLSSTMEDCVASVGSVSSSDANAGFILQG